MRPVLVAGPAFLPLWDRRAVEATLWRVSEAAGPGGLARGVRAHVHFQRGQAVPTVDREW